MNYKHDSVEARATGASYSKFISEGKMKFAQFYCFIFMADRNYVKILREITVDPSEYGINGESQGSPN